MSYARYTNHAGRECGYAVEATCDYPGCEAVIDRGYSYLCGTPDRITNEKPGPGCGGYFCEKHKGFVGEIKGEDGNAESECVSLCDNCKIDPKSLAYLKDEELDEAIEMYGGQYGQVALATKFAAWLIAYAEMVNSTETVITFGTSTVTIKP